MKIHGSALIVLSAILLLSSGCKKKDTSESLKEQLIYKLTGEINTDSIRSFDTWLQNMGTRFAFADNNRFVALSIRNRFISMGYSNTVLDSFTVSKVYSGISYTRTDYNVIATLEGSSGSDSISIIGAHYDDINGTGDPFTSAPGANDNGSGTSAVLEVARVFAGNKFAPEMTIRFVAFGAEE